MRVRVQSSRTVWLLFLVAFVAAGVMAMWSSSQRTRERPAPAPRPAEVELEVVE